LHAKINSRPTLKKVNGMISGASGDMTKAVYDTDNSGVVDDAEKLGGQLPAAFEQVANKGVAGGYVPLNSSTQIDSTYLPSYVDDVLEYANLASFPVTGSTGKIYIDIATGKQYRWSGSAYIQITNGLIATTNDLPEGSSNLYFTVARVLASALTGLSAASGTFTATDTILVAFNKCKYLIDNLGTLVLATTLTGLSSSSGTYTSSDTLLTALNKLKYFLDNYGASIRAEVTLFSDATDGTPVTAAGVNTISKISPPIAGNTVTVGDILDMQTLFEKNAISATNGRVYINTAANLTGAQLLATVNPAAGDRYNPIVRRLVVKSTTSTKIFATGSNVATDLGTSTQATASINIDWTQTQYFLYTGQNNVTGESNNCTHATLKRTR